MSKASVPGQGECRAICLAVPPPYARQNAAQKECVSKGALLASAHGRKGRFLKAGNDPSEEPIRGPNPLLGKGHVVGRIQSELTPFRLLG